MFFLVFASGKLWAYFLNAIFSTKYILPEKSTKKKIKVNIY